MSDQPARPIIINGMALDSASEVLRNASGKEIPLRAQSFAVLKHLALNADRIVAKDELMDAVWPGIAVTGK